MATTYQEHLQQIAQQFPQLTPDVIDGYWNDLELGGCYLSFRGATFNRPYRVLWKTSGDRKVKGEYRAVDFWRSRCFGSAEAAVRFMEEMQ